MYTPNILKYTVTFQPNNVGSYTPDRIVFKNVSQLLITMTSTGQQCQIREGGGMPSRKRRTEQRKMNLLNGIEKEDNEHPKEEKDKKEEEVAIKDENENAKKIEEIKNNMIKNNIIRAKLKSQAEMRKVILDKNSKKAEKVALEKEPEKVAKEQEEKIEIKEKETKEKENVDVEKK